MSNGWFSLTFPGAEPDLAAGAAVGDTATLDAALVPLGQLPTCMMPLLASKESTQKSVFYISNIFLKKQIVFKLSWFPCQGKHVPKHIVACPQTYRSSDGLSHVTVGRQQCGWQMTKVDTRLSTEELNADVPIARDAQTLSIGHLGFRCAAQLCGLSHCCGCHQQSW